MRFVFFSPTQQTAYAAPQQPAYVAANQTYAATPARPATQYSGYDQGSHTAYAAYTPAAQPAQRPVGICVYYSPLLAGLSPGFDLLGWKIIFSCLLYGSPPLSPDWREP